MNCYDAFWCNECMAQSSNKDKNSMCILFVWLINPFGRTGFFYKCHSSWNYALTHKPNFHSHLMTLPPYCTFFLPYIYIYINKIIIVTSCFLISLPISSFSRRQWAEFPCKGPCSSKSEDRGVLLSRGVPQLTGGLIQCCFSSSTLFLK